MANHGFLTSKKTFKFNEVNDILNEVNNNFFERMLEIKSNQEERLWQVSWKDDKTASELRRP